MHEVPDLGRRVPQLTHGVADFAVEVAGVIHGLPGLPHQPADFAWPYAPVAAALVFFLPKAGLKQ